MTTIEEQILDQFKKLDSASQQRVIQSLLGTVDGQRQFDFLSWHTDTQIITRHLTPGPSVIEMLDSIRDGDE